MILVCFLLLMRVIGVFGFGLSRSVNWLGAIFCLMCVRGVGDPLDRQFICVREANNI